MKIAIIGTAGRGADALKMGSELFSKMVLVTKQIIENDLKQDSKSVDLISGGLDFFFFLLFCFLFFFRFLPRTQICPLLPPSPPPSGAAWSDHVAVELWIQGKRKKPSFCSLTLYAPAPFIFHKSRPRFLVKQQQHSMENPGKSANNYHLQFSRKIGRSSHQEIQLAVELGAKIEVGNGFQARNSMIANNADAIIAFTWGKSFPPEGGTRDTWNKHRGKNKIHVSLQALSKEKVDDKD